MRNVFITTTNTKRFLAAIAALKERGAGEACLMVVDGEPGLSKSKTALWWATQNNAALLRATAEWTPAWMLSELLAQITKEPPAHGFRKMFKQALARLAQNAADAAREGRTFAVIIDEADYIIGTKKLMDTVRDLSDFTEIPFILIGMGRIRHQLKRFPQVVSRVSQIIEFERCGLDDTRAICRGLCEVELADDLVEWLHGISKGYVREIKEALAPIERFGRRNTGPATLAALAGQILLVDRSTGKPIRVPPAPVERGHPVPPGK
jgi:urease gamma subunit